MTRTLPAEGWRRVGELFHRALELPTDQRVDFAERECATDPEALIELKSLIDSDRKAAQDFVGDRVKAGVRAYASGGGIIPQRAGAYRLVKEIGRGGMGTVYLGQRDDEQYEIKVAVKVVSPGMDTEFVLKRFRRERQTLANLQHPNIARLLDGGNTDEGLPYIVMEFVDGPHINEYCRVHEYTLEQRLGLFVDVCAAVEHAHRSFVVHRDLKPGNILVNEAGIPKLLDFGICKLLYSDPALADQTLDQGARMMTPDYAAPEQVRGEKPTIVSDVYSLGAVLYELLTDAKPHRFTNYTLPEIERVICDEESLKPSTVAATKAQARRLTGDLDTIVMRTLQKDPSRRYQTVDQLADDVRRHLRHEPVLARPDTILYRTHKLLRRRAGWLAAASAVTLALCGGIVASNHQARIANERLQQVRRLANIFVTEVHDAVRPLPGSTKARALILKTGVEYLDTLAGSAASDPVLQSELAASYIKIGDLQGDDSASNVGQIEQALSNYEKARRLIASALRQEPRNRSIRNQQFILDFQTGRLLYSQRDKVGSLAALQRAAGNGEQLLAENPQDEDARERLAETYAQIGLAHRSTGEAKANLAALVKATALLDGAPAARKADPQFEYLAAAGVSQRGLAEVMAGEKKEGLAHLRAAAERLDALCARVPQNTDYARQAMMTWSHNADSMFDLKDATGASSAGERFAAIARRLHEADAADDRATNDYAIALMKVSGYIPESEPARRLDKLTPAVAILRETVAANPKNAQSRIFLAAAEIRMGDSLRAAGNHAQGEAMWRAAMNDAQPLIESGNLPTAEVYVQGCQRLGEVAALQGNRALAEDYAARAWRVADPKGDYARMRPAIQGRLLAARGQVAVGVIRARLGDKAVALGWLQGGQRAWRELKSDPAYNPTYQKLLDTAETELARLGAQQ